MKRFKGFSNDQTHQLLKEFGYTGPAQKDDMDAFLASSPSAASQLGRYKDIARQRVEGKPLSGIGMQAGGNVANMVAINPDPATFTTYDPTYRPVSRITNTPTARRGPAPGIGFDGRPIDPNDPFQGDPSVMPDFSKYPGYGTDGNIDTEAFNNMGNLTEQERAMINAARSDSVTEEESEQINPLSKLSPSIQKTIEESQTVFNPDNLSTATQDIVATSEAKSKEASDISSRLTKEFYDTQMYSGTHPSGRSPMTPEVGEEMRAFIENNPEFKAAREEADKAARDASTAIEGDPAYQTFVQSTQAPEGTQVLQPGTPTPEITEASQLLDTAQENLASATRNLTKVQTDMSGKDPEDVYYRRDDYSELSDGTDAEREAAAEDFMTPILAHIASLRQMLLHQNK